jgi:tetratricopeptide (TPR) repeat protein
LALEQAGVYIAKDEVSFAAYLATYQREHLKLLEKYGPQAGVSRLSVATTWKTSMARVPAAARELLAAVSHLAPSANPYELFVCAPDALGPVLAVALSDQTEADPLAALLGCLQEYSLVQTDRDARTFSLHKLLQEVVRQDQTKAERSEWMERWVRVFDQFLPKDAEYQESAPYSRGLPAFAALFARMDEKHPAIKDAARLAAWYVHHFNLRGRWREGEPLAVQALQVRERVLGPEHPSTLNLVNNLAALYRSQGQYAEAEPLYQRALTARERVLGAEHPDTLMSVSNLAVLYWSQGRYAEAEPLFQRALAARERVLGPEHPDTLGSVNNLAGLYDSQERYAEAEPLYQRALAAKERVLGREHPSTLTSVNNLAFLYKSQGRYAEAEPLYQRALAACERVLDPEHPDTLSSVNNLAGLYWSQGRYAKAEPLFQRALAAKERVLGPEHPSTLTSVNNLAGLYESQGRYAEAEPLYQRALAGLERVLGKDHPNTKMARENLKQLRARGK